MPLDLAYLKVETAEPWLERDGILVPDNLESLLAEIESQIDTWLYWRPALTLYDKEPHLKLKHRSQLFLKHSHVVRIVDVRRVVYSSDKGTDEAIAATLADPFAAVEENTWETVRTWEFDGTNVVTIQDYWGGVEGTLYDVRYWAGLHPLPPIFESVAYRALTETIEYGDMGWMYLPTSDATSLSLPGGLSSSRKVGDTKERNQRDRLFQDLAQYRCPTKLI